MAKVRSLLLGSRPADRHCACMLLHVSDTSYDLLHDRQHVGSQLEEDVRDECAEYGTVEGVCIPTTPRTMPPDEPGRAYIMFGSHEEASKAKPVFDGRLFDSVKVTAKLVPDEDFSRAAAGEWIHLPMPGGLPAHPGHSPPSIPVCCLHLLSLLLCCLSCHSSHSCLSAVMPHCMPSI